jgi:hypothetical protein
MESLGIQKVYDPFCNPLGTYMSPHTLDHNNQSRCDARIAYYDPIFGENGTPRSNLNVLLSNMATKIITSDIDGVVRVTGIEVSIYLMHLFWSVAYWLPGYSLHRRLLTHAKLSTSQEKPLYLVVQYRPPICFSFRVLVRNQY